MFILEYSKELFSSIIRDLTTSQRNMKDAIVFFNIKDKSLFANNQCIAEAFLSFGDIPEYSQENATKQIHLTLTRLQSDGE